MSCLFRPCRLSVRLSPAIRFLISDSCTVHTRSLVKFPLARFDSIHIRFLKAESSSVLPTKGIFEHSAFCRYFTTGDKMGNKSGKYNAEEEKTDGKGTERDEECVQVVAKVGDLADGEMREVNVGEGKALLVHQNGEYFACGHKCTHYGAPLVKGSLGNGRVRCPWHGACFNIKSGDIEDFPGLDGIPSFKVKVEGEDVVVKASKAALSKTKRTMPMAPYNQEEDSRVFLIVGGGPAGLECAESLRQEGYKGRIVMVTRENVLPYDRPKLSKAMSVKAEDIALRPPSFFEEHGIEVQFSKEASGLNVAEKTVSFNDGSNLKFDKVFLGTGSTPRTIPVPGIDLENVFLLRDPANANAINAAAEGKRVVLVGTGFIGMEVAAFLSSKASSVTCVDLLKVPFEPILGPTVGAAIQKFQEEKGNIKFKLEVGLKEFVGADGKLTGVKISTDEVIEADVAIVGIGVVPSTSFLKESSLELTRRGEVVVDETMKAGEDVYAGGDIVRFPLPLIGDTANIGHWQIAHNHGRVAAKNMLGKKEAFNSIPFFWTVLHGKSLRYCGHALSWDDIIIEGNPQEYTFAAYYVKDNKVLAVCSMNMDPVVSKSAELMYRGKMPPGDEIRSNPGLILDIGNLVEEKVAKVGDLKDGEMKEVTLGKGKALLVHQNGEYFACGHKCTHYGAPLVKGSLGNGRVRCPWHGACFNIKSGDIEDFPGLDGIPSFKVKTEGDDIIVQAKKAQLENFRRTFPVCGADTKEDPRLFLIIGGGAAAQECAETLRQEGFKGRVVMVTKEPCYPYDRPRLSKTPHTKAEELALRKPPFYEEHGIEILLEKEASGVNMSEKTATFTDGTTIKFDSLFIATGGTPRVPKNPGADLKNIFVLRSPTQGNILSEAAKDKHLIVIGVGFIGMEMAAYFQDKAASVTVLGNGEPFAKVFGEEVGKAMRKLAETKGIKFIIGDGVKEFVGEDGMLTGVVLNSGAELKADICIAGIGCVPATDFLKESGLNLTQRGEIVVDETMKAGEDVYAGGDIVRFPLPLIGDTANIGHWQIAHNHGRVAAKNMLGMKEAFNSIPFFWCLLLGKGIRFCGHSANWDDLIIHGNLEEYKFAVFFIKGDKVSAVCTIGTNAAVHAAELMFQGKMLSPDEIRSNPAALMN